MYNDSGNEENVTKEFYTLYAATLMNLNAYMETTKKG